jgi:hypothetical protein
MISMTFVTEKLPNWHGDAAIYTEEASSSDYRRLEVLMVVNMSVLVFWVVPLCGIAVGYKRLRGTCCLYRQHVPPKRWYLNYMSTWHYNPANRHSGSEKKRLRKYE